MGTEDLFFSGCASTNEPQCEKSLCGMKTWIRNARLVSPGWERPGSLLIEEGRIVSIHSPDEVVSADETMDACGGIVLPGFVDIHAHGADGADVCDATVDAVHHIARTKLKEGVTTWLPTTLTQPAERLLAIMEVCGAAMRNDEGLCRMPGVHLEGPYINAEKAGAQNPEYVRLPDVRELKKLHAAAPIRIVSLAPEMPGALDLIRTAHEMGIVCSAAHTQASYHELMLAVSQGLSHLTHFGNAMTPLHHREIGVVGAGLLHDRLMLEVISDGEHLCREMLELIFHQVPAERIMLITDSVSASWQQDGEMRLGGLEAEIRNGVARLKNGTLAGSTLKFNEGLARAHALGRMPLSELVRATSWNQARSLGLEGIGKLEPGYHADLVLLDHDFSVRDVWARGQHVDG